MKESLSDVSIYLSNCTPFNGMYAIAKINEQDVFGYVFTCNGQHVFTSRAAQRTRKQPCGIKQTGEIETRFIREAPNYLSCAPPHHWWEPVDKEQVYSILSFKEMSKEDGDRFFSESDRLEVCSAISVRE